MTGTNLQRRRNKQGVSLILLVGIIGLAFIVTVAAFLVAASTGQDTARLAAAKVDIANREEVLMREILQQTATGLLPSNAGISGNPQTWTTIMTSAVTPLNAANGTTYVDPTELAALLPLNPALNGVIPANLGDTGGTMLGIFQGYNAEVPYGGTTGLPNVVSPYNATVQPPLMNWSSGNATLSSSTALTTPQEFFLGSQYSTSSSTTSAPVTNLSLSNRWGNIAYPNIRFGYKQSGDTNFIARRVWWRIPVLYQTAQKTVEAPSVSRYPSALANYELSVYEIPSQLPISGNANLQIGLNGDGTGNWGSAIQVTGSIYGGQVQLSGGTYGGVSSRQQVNVLKAATVGGVSYASSTDNAFDQPGTQAGNRETMALTQTPGVTAPVSVAGNDGKVLLVPVMPGNQFYMSVATPTHWDLYARPYYRCRIRVIISGTNSTVIYSPSQTPQINTAAGAITVQTIYSSDAAKLPDQILGFPDSAATTTTVTQTSIATGGLPTYMNYTSTAAGDRNLLVIDVPAMITALGTGTLSTSAPQLYSIYIGSNQTLEPAAPPSPAPPPYTEPGVAITNTNDLTAFTSGLSIVSNQTLYLLGPFNQVTATPAIATSIYAPQVRYGLSGVIANVSLTGQISVDPTSSATTAVNPLSLANASGTQIPATSISATFGEIIRPSQIPPIQRMSLMFTIEKERTN